MLQRVLQSETIRAISAFLGFAVRCSVQYVAECVAVCVAERDNLCDICIFVQINMLTCIYLSRSANISDIKQMNTHMCIYFDRKCLRVVKLSFVSKLNVV